MILGHIMGLPIEETTAAVPAVAIVVSGFAVVGRWRLRRMREQLWRR